MKIIIFTILLALFSLFSAVAQLPYSKMMGLSKEELLEKKFKYDKKKNRYILTKTDGLNNATNILNALSGEATTYQPSPKDYAITLQYGKLDSLSSLTVVFYNDDTYNEIQTWLAENNVQTTSSGSGKVSIVKFMYNDFSVEMRGKAVIQSVGQTTAGGYAANSSSVDKSYTIYTYTIFTGVNPDSPWHTKEQLKKEKNKAKGKKESLNDLL